MTNGHDKSLSYPRTFTEENGILDDESGLLMKLNIEEDPRLFGQLRAEWRDKEERYPKWTRSLFGVSSVCCVRSLKNLREGSKFSSGNLIREFDLVDKIYLDGSQIFGM